MPFATLGACLVSGKRETLLLKFQDLSKRKESSSIIDLSLQQTPPFKLLISWITLPQNKKFTQDMKEVQSE